MMNILQNRIESYQNNSIKWPHTDKQYPKIEAFARAGFYFMRRPKAADSIRCFMCDVELSHWKQSQSPYSRHSAESPQCPWTLLNFPDVTNRSLIVNEKDIKTQPHHKLMRSARLATFNHHHYWPPNKSVRSKRFQAASKLADAGFYFTPTLENSARIKCPYCKSSILEPEKSLDALEKHREMNSTCPFFQRPVSFRARSRRDTVTSTASNETYTTAISQLGTCDEENSTLVPQKRKAVSEKEDNNHEGGDDDDDSIWDINKVLDVPAYVKKPAHTYGKKSTAKRDRKAQLASSNKRANVDIFSGLNFEQLSMPKTSATNSKKLSLIEKVLDNPMPKPKPKSNTSKPKINATPPLSPLISPPALPLPEETSLMSPTFPPPGPPAPLQEKHALHKEMPIQINEQSKATSKPEILSSQNNILNEKVEHITPAIKDKGKGRAVEHAVASKKPISLSKSRKSNPTTVSATLSSPSRTRNSDVSASIAQQMKYLQSTPINSINKSVNVMDIFGDCPMSPITSGNHTGNSSSSSSISNNNGMRTPATFSVVEGGRTRSLITNDGQRRPLPSLSTTAKAAAAAPPPVMSLEKDSVPLVTGDQKKMTVETYLQQMVNENIKRVREEGNQMIASIRERSEAIKQDLLRQKD